MIILRNWVHTVKCEFVRTSKWEVTDDVRACLHSFPKQSSHKGIRSKMTGSTPETNIICQYLSKENMASESVKQLSPETNHTSIVTWFMKNDSTMLKGKSSLSVNQPNKLNILGGKKSWPNLILHTKIYCRWIANLNMKCPIIKLLEENISEHPVALK